jgi:SNF2 family DNA or RNA helicase
MQSMESMTLSDFIQTFSDSLQRKVLDTMKPVYTPKEETTHEFQCLKRMPYPAQAHTAKAVFDTLEHQSSVYVVGEMGTGKTQVSISTVSLFQNPQRILVLCPPHLVSKWEREIKSILPDVRVVQLRKLSQILCLKGRRPEKPATHEFWILSRERAKLNHSWKPVWAKRTVNYACPSCGQFFEEQKQLSEKKREKCAACKESLWQATPPKRFALATFIRRWLKGYFNIIIADEAHEYKGDSIQGQALGELASCIKKRVLLTGTLLGGYAYNLFNLLWRTHTDVMKQGGYFHSSVTRFQDEYGFIERIIREEREEDYLYGRGKRRNVRVKPLPGISPLLLPHFLLPNAVFLRLSDVAEALPPYEEQVITLDMEESQADEYRQVENLLSDIVKASLRVGSQKNLASYLQGLLLIPDAVFRRNDIEVEISDKRKVIANLPVEGLMPKEAELLDIVKKEKDEGRKVLVYCTFTNTRDITPRLTKLLEEKEVRVEVLKSHTISPEHREEWLHGTIQRGVDVLICNPEVVKTGLDLYQFQTVVFYETGYSIYTLRQASRRSWRIGQTKPVKVLYLCYKGTMQEKALRLIASKLETSLVVEGELSDKGLQALSQAEGSMVLELARALVEGLPENESLSETWARTRRKEIEADLTGTEKKVTVKEVSKTISQVGNRVLTVDVIESARPRKKKVTRLQVSEGDLETVFKERGKQIQFALF